MTKNKIKVSIIILNYFGEKVIEKTITSVLNSNYPSSQYEIIVVDNNSRDNSRRILNRLSKKYKNLNLLFLKKNYGFSAGNNRGIRVARGDYVILLNNDCLVDPDWLPELIKSAESNDNIFAVTSKILLYSKYVELTFDKDASDILTNCRIIKSNLLNFCRQKYLNLDFECNQNIKINLPYDQLQDTDINLDLDFLDRPSSALIHHLSNLSYVSKVKKRSHRLSLVLNTQDKKIVTDSYNKIQNAGSVVFQDGYSRDTGAKVKYMHQDYEADRGQYNSSSPVYAVCGAATLFKKKILDAIGCLDETFFMYYEDIEISERARLAGYQNVFSPKAIVRHLHALSSQEWSPFFIFHTERGRLLHIFYHFPRKIFVQEYLKLLFTAPAKNYCLHYSRILLWFLFNLRLILKNRRHYHEIYPPTAVKTNYRQVLSGYWLSN